VLSFTVTALDGLSLAAAPVGGAPAPRRCARRPHRPAPPGRLSRCP